MEELRTALSENGFTIPDLQLNGRVTRLDRTGKNSAWFVGFEHKNNKGDSFVVAVYGDWKTGEKFEYKTKGKRTQSDNAAISRRLRDAQKSSELEREKLQEGAKREAASLWSEGGPNDRSDYLHRKSIPSLYNCLSVLRENGRVVLVPMRDSDGELWGVQSIYPEGQKYFLTGQRIEGLFHIVGPESELALTDVIYICEGYATATTLHQALGKPIVCAFNAQNLVHVAKDLKKKYNTSAFVICADDDQFTTRIVDGEEVAYNPGRVYGEKAAKACAGNVIFPSFAALESKPTDFNDLHILEGLITVKGQIVGSEPPERQYIIGLGYSAEKYFYTSSQNNYIRGLTPSAHNKLNLLSIMDLEFWQNSYPNESADDDVNWTMAIDDMMTKCRAKGPFNLNNVRATGAWLGEKKELIVNRGDCLIVDNKKVGFHSVKGRYIYEPADMTIPEPGPDILSIDEGIEFMDTIDMLRWAHPDYFKYICGWLVVAPICGALEWRPHIWLSGPSGSGKSTIMNEVVHRLLKKRGLFFQGSSTEAGIRQSVGKKSLPVVWDEFETTDERSGQKVAGGVELFRQASYETDAQITKGTSLGESISYSTRFCGMVSAININLINEADKNRFTICELLRGLDDQEKSMKMFQAFQKKVSAIDEDWVERFHNRTISLFPTFSHNREMIFKVISERYTSRLGQQYAPLLAGYQLLQSDQKIDLIQAQAIVGDCDLEFKLKEADESDEMECLKYLMGKTTFVNGPVNQDLSHYELISGASNENGYSSNYVDNAKRMGFIIKDGKLLVINNHPYINSVFKGTRWHGLYQRSLIRINGADNNSNKPVYSNGASHKVVRIPLEVITPLN